MIFYHLCLGGVLIKIKEGREGRRGKREKKERKGEEEKTRKDWEDERAGGEYVGI